jgi:hypothetical protein
METPMKLTRAQAMPILNLTYPEYLGRKITLTFVTQITFHDVNWGGGTRNQYKFLRDDGASASLPTPAPWVNPYEGLTMDLPVGVLVVRHSFFCGHNVGIVIYANPAYLPKWLEAGEGDAV